MFAALLALFLIVDPFWVAKAPKEWTDVELVKFLTDSPWAQMAEAPKAAAQPQPVLVFLATAAPMLQAEEERERRAKAKRLVAKLPEPQDELAEEYKLWLEDNRPTQIVVAVRVPNLKAFSQESEIRLMEQGTFMRVGRTKVQMTGHFPPSTSDPYLRFAFPRKQIKGEEKALAFDLYIPGVASPFRQVEFAFKDLVLNGRPEF
jgi:hypothetical protein